MPILNFTIRSQDVDFAAESATDARQAQKTIKLEQHLKLKYLKLLHIYHNLDNSNISDGDGTSNNTILFAQISFLNGKNSVFFEFQSGKTIEHAGMICLGETIKDEGSSVFKDLYKVLHDGKQLLYINQPFSVKLFKLVAVDPADGNTDLATYNAAASHKIQPISIQEFRGPLDGPGQYISFTFEYQEDTTK
tara:strand:+ start:4058 stop:4633 length:576 start_codon:yes stop_codon:yes gene_type:complete